MQPVGPYAAPKPKGTILLWLGGLLVLAGIVLGVLLVISGVRSISDRVNGLQRVPLATGGPIEISDPGTYRVYLERADLSPSLNVDSRVIVIRAVQVRTPSGGLVALQPDPIAETYNFSGHHGRKIGRFRADRPGRYRLVVQEFTGSSRIGQLAVGRRGPTGAVATILGGVFGGGAMVVVGIVLLIIGGVRRSRSRRLPPGGYPGGVSGWAPPPVPGAWAGAPGSMPGSAPGPWGQPPVPSGWGQPAPGGWAPPPVAPGSAAPPPSPGAWSPSGVADAGPSPGPSS